eukprot:gene6203-2820_t
MDDEAEAGAWSQNRRLNAGKTSDRTRMNIVSMVGTPSSSRSHEHDRRTSPHLSSTLTSHRPGRHLLQPYIHALSPLCPDVHRGGAQHHVLLESIFGIGGLNRVMKYVSRDSIARSLDHRRTKCSDTGEVTLINLACWDYLDVPSSKTTVSSDNEMHAPRTPFEINQITTSAMGVSDYEGTFVSLNGRHGMFYPIDPAVNEVYIPTGAIPVNVVDVFERKGCAAPNHRRMSNAMPRQLFFDW